MNFIHSYSSNIEPVKAVSEIKTQLSGMTPQAVIYFASSNYDPETLSAEMNRAFPDSTTFGCTTSGEIVSGKMLDNSIVAMGLNNEVIADHHTAIINLDDPESMTEAIKGVESHFQIPMSGMDRNQYFGVILIDGLSVGEETLMDNIGNLTDIMIIGGSAGDDLKFKQTHVFANGKALSGSAVLTVFKSRIKFDLIKTQSFRSTGKKLVATRVEESTRTVMEFNGMPARKAYAEALGKSEEEAGNYFMSNPVGLMIGDEPYVRSPQQFKGDNLVFYCQVKEGMELDLLNSTDIVTDTARAVQEKNNELGNISAIINFHCILRTLELKQNSATDAYGDIFSDIPAIGFSTYGEQYIGHINQTSTMLVFNDQTSI